MSHIYNIVPKKILLTPKAYSLLDNNGSNQITFVTVKEVTKFDIACLFELLEIRIKKINVMNYKSEVIGFKNRKGRTGEFKKFIVSINSSENAIDILNKMISKEYVAKLDR